MKRIIIAIASALVACSVVCHADPDSKTVVINTVTTNATPLATDSATTEAPVISGWLEALHFNITGASTAPTCTVSVVTLSDAGSGTLTNRTILSALVITADTTVQPRLLADTTAGVDITNAPVKIPLINDKVKVNAYLGVTNAGQFNVECDIIYSHRP